MSKGEQDKEIDMSFVYTRNIAIAASAYEQQINDDNSIKSFL